MFGLGSNTLAVVVVVVVHYDIYLIYIFILVRVYKCVCVSVYLRVEMLLYIGMRVYIYANGVRKKGLFAAVLDAIRLAPNSKHYARGALMQRAALLLRSVYYKLTNKISRFFPCYTVFSYIFDLLALKRGELD